MRMSEKHNNNSDNPLTSRYTDGGKREIQKNLHSIYCLIVPYSSVVIYLINVSLAIWQFPFFFSIIEQTWYHEGWMHTWSKPSSCHKYTLIYVIWEATTALFIVINSRFLWGLDACMRGLNNPFPVPGADDVHRRFSLGPASLFTLKKNQTEAVLFWFEFKKAAS